MVRIGSWTNLVLVLLGLALVEAMFSLARDYAVSCLAGLGPPNVAIAYEAVLVMIISVACFAYPVLSRRKGFNRSMVELKGPCSVCHGRPDEN
ncbi:hypothetical protein MUP05_00710 [Candidatus Bathyarchaeota archaeon]|nr:hypothetical protein [Candidatus Bathyarchaeota archaeon]